MTETNEKVEPKPIEEKESVKTWFVPCLLKKGSLSGCLNSA